MSSRCTLAVGEALVLEARGGPPEAELALFEAGDIELHASEPGSIREAGYRTTVGEARARLAEAGFTPELAEEIAAASRRVVARAYARGAAARCMVERLEAVELIESRAFDPATGAYQGTWLDLGGLASDLALPRATMLLRATYLAAYLAEIPEDEHIFLSTAELSAMRRPGERTFRRVVLDDPRALLDALTAFEPNRMRAPESGTTESGPTRLDIVRWLRQRARQRPDAETRLLAMEASLSAREAPTRGPLAETALWQVETKLSRGETGGVSEQLDAIEQRRGRMPGSIYLRARAALVSRSEDPHVIAERVSALSTSMAAFHELQLLAAQAWAAAGDARRARAFARDLLENTGADDVLRMQAHEVLETVGAASSAVLPHAPPSDPDPIEPQRILSVHPAPGSPMGDSQSEIATQRRPDADPAEVSIPGPPLAPTGTGDMRSGRASALAGASALARPQSAPIRPSSELRALPPGTSLPPTASSRERSVYGLSRPRRKRPPSAWRH